MDRLGLPFILLIYITIGCKSPGKVNEYSKRTPNIIFIMSDDQGYADLGCYGSDAIKTPSLDRMAGEGMLFTQVYAGSPVCAPARCSLMTGKHTGHISRRDNRTTHDNHKAFLDRKLIPLPEEDFTIAELMKKAGYRTAGFGKWGLGNLGTSGFPVDQGFDEFFGYYDQVHAHDYYTDYLMHNQDTFRIVENQNNQRTVYTHELIAERALQYVRENKDYPFFLYLPYTLPHGKYEVPDNSLYADQEWPEKVKNYAAMISLLDRDIGALLSLLEELNLDDNTIVFFTSDNGPNPPFIKDLESNKPFRGVKRQLLEGGIRVPMIVRWPDKIKPGSVSDYTWGFWDVMPTMAAIAGMEAPENIDGISVLPTLMGKSQTPKEFLYWEYYSPFQQAVRMGKWKGIRLGTKEELHLFDLSDDMQEKNNLAEEYPAIAEKIIQIMNEEHSPIEYWPLVEYTSSTAKKILNP